MYCSSIEWIFYFKEMRFSSMRIVPVLFGTEKEHTPLPRENKLQMLLHNTEESENSVGIWTSSLSQGEFNNLNIAEVN
jgi:hypothetical protein